MLMSGFLYQRNFILLASILYWGCGLFLLQSFAQNRSELLTTEQQQEIRREIALVRSNIEAKIFENIYKADSLASIITIDPEFGLKRWNELAGKLVQSSSFIRNVGVAPDNIIRKVYPLPGNEKALGFDFRTNPEQYASVLKAKDLGSVYLDGPLELVQGGQAIIARFPIFSDFPLKNEYWGSVSIVLDYEELLQESGIYSLNNVSIAIQRHYSHKEDPVTFFGSPGVFNQSDILLPIHLPNAQWYLAGHFELKSPDMNLIYALGFAGIALFYSSLLMLLRAYRISHNASLQDELTQLPNRRFIMSYLENITSESSPSNFALLNVDLNDFKKANDEFGHDIGDQLLKHIAHSLKQAITERDTVARVGGDEFLVILSNTRDANQASERIEKIKASLTNNPMVFKSTKTEPHNEEIIIPSLSIGFALFNPSDPISIEELLNIADQHMYLSKKKDKARA
ncbi:diguanylate cyclase [Oceanospirillum sp. HFRX-1_2]